MLIHSSSRPAPRVLRRAEAQVLRTRRRRVYLELIWRCTSTCSARSAPRWSTRRPIKRLEIGLHQAQRDEGAIVAAAGELTELQPELRSEGRRTEELLIQVEHRPAPRRTSKKEKVSAEEAAGSEQGRRGRSSSPTTRAADLDAAMPALNNAVKALDALDKKSTSARSSRSRAARAVKMVHGGRVHPARRQARLGLGQEGALATRTS